jgi:hypothetical protein
MRTSGTIGRERRAPRQRRRALRRRLGRFLYAASVSTAAASFAWGVATSFGSHPDAGRMVVFWLFAVAVWIFGRAALSLLAER